MAFIGPFQLRRFCVPAVLGMLLSVLDSRALCYKNGMELLRHVQWRDYETNSMRSGCGNLFTRLFLEKWQKWTGGNTNYICFGLFLADNGTMHLWDWRTGYNFQRVHAAVQPGSLDSESGIFACVFDQSESRLLTAEADKTIKVYKEDDTAVRQSVSFMSFHEITRFEINFRHINKEHVYTLWNLLYSYLKIMCVHESKEDSSFLLISYRLL